jgi:hypothetical protein
LNLLSDAINQLLLLELLVGPGSYSQPGQRYPSVECRVADVARSEAASQLAVLVADGAFLTAREDLLADRVAIRDNRSGAR